MWVLVHLLLRHSVFARYVIIISRAGSYWSVDNYLVQSSTPLRALFLSYINGHIILF
jgi:hypothetical protein